LLPLALLLGACGDADRDELQQWMVSERAQVRPRIQPITELKKFTPQQYTELSAIEPFNLLKLTQALRRDSSGPSNTGLIAPELARRKEALESYPLDAMAMVGSLQSQGKPVALVAVDKLLYQVRVGEYL